MKLEGVNHNHYKHLPCGLFILKSHLHIGATPDNIFTYKCCEHRICMEYIKASIQFLSTMYQSRGIKLIFLEKLMMLFS